MRILLTHAFYQQQGGEDLSFRAEEALLRSRGEEVETFTVHNSEVEEWSPVAKARNLFWNRDSHRRLGAVLDTFRPDVLHVQNWFPGLSPSVYHAAAKRSIPVVQKLSNYRMFCVNGTFFRDGKPCESCLGSHLAWRAAVHGCFRDNRPLSGALAAATGVHWALGTWTRHIQAYMALDEDGRERFVQAGLPEQRIHVKPNFLDPFPAPGTGEGGFVLFAGRLSQEKGADTLIRAWRMDPALPVLQIAGDGPLMARLRVDTQLDPRIRFLGSVPHDRLQQLMGSAVLTVVPSEFREPFGRVALESLGCGTPVLASRSGALKHIVVPGVNGGHFEAGDATHLVTAARDLLSDRVRLAAMRGTARQDAMLRFGADENYRILMEVYEAAAAALNGPPGRPGSRASRAPVGPEPSRPSSGPRPHRTKSRLSRRV